MTEVDKEVALFPNMLSDNETRLSSQLCLEYAGPMPCSNPDVLKPASDPSTSSRTVTKMFVLANLVFTSRTKTLESKDWIIDSHSSIPVNEYCSSVWGLRSPKFRYKRCQNCREIPKSHPRDP